MRDEEAAMPSVSRESASESIRLEGFHVRLENLEGGYIVMAALESGRRER
jgi:hypothetical protein